MNWLTPFEAERDTVWEWVKFTIDVAKGVGLASIPFGLFLTCAYLTRVGAPLPLVDSSISYVLLLVVASYSFIMSFLVTFLFAPSFFCRVDKKERDLVANHRNGLWKWMIFHSPGLFLILAVGTAIFLNVSLPSYALFMGFGFITGMLVSVTILICYLSAGERRLKAVSRAVPRSFLILSGNLVRGLMALIWLLSILQLFVFVARNTLHPPTDPYWATGLCLALALTYGLLTSSCAILIRMIALIPLLGTAVALFNPSYAGSVGLRVLGIGGGIPISLSVKGLAEAKVGCLILRSSSETIVRPVKEPTRDKCQIPLSSFIQNTDTNVEMFAEVEVLPNSQVIQINQIQPVHPENGR